ncbi:hypothetical protein GOC74_02145 [Halomicrobium mukohataei]|uniref:CopG family transcriptional regulator n=1 Tax=Halomicrobium mukohataei TaxID=57705 RepID=A0A847U6X5_9EURY|nr:hypothetical protein [Halomicrobium mukohataei]NLV08739.1 hypothetical protein [Halomicrobium mukohataei]
MRETPAVSVPQEHINWADRNYLRLGYRSRSALICDALRHELEGQQ